MPRNAYAVTHTGGTPDNTAPVMPDPDMARYAVPSVLDSNPPYADTYGWGPELRTGIGTEPDAQRIGATPVRDFRPTPNRPPDEFWQQLDADDERRHAVETQDADGWQENKNAPGYTNPAHGGTRFAPNPRLVPPPEPRVTQQLAPRRYSFTRPFDVSSARTFNGVHFSMAGHRRNYEVGGMAPQRKPGAGSRNTYRLDPVPWDESIVDMPAASTIGVPVDARITAVEVPPSSASRSWRL